MVKQEVLKLIGNMSEDVSIDEIMYKLYILEKHNKALSDIHNGRVYTSDEVGNLLVRQ